MHAAVALSLVWGFAGAASAAGLAPRQTDAATTTAAEPEVTAITGCHFHESSVLVSICPRENISQLTIVN